LKSISGENFLQCAAHTLGNPYCEFTISFSKGVGMAKRNIRVKREAVFAVKFALGV